MNLRRIQHHLHRPDLQRLPGVKRRFPDRIAIDKCAVGRIQVADENKIPIQLTRCAVRTTPDGTTGSEHFMLKRHSLDRDSLVQLAQKIHAELPA